MYWPFAFLKQTTEIYLEIKKLCLVLECYLNTITYIFNL